MIDPDNGDGRVDQAQAATILKLRQQLAQVEEELRKRDSDAGFGSYVRRGKQVVGLVVAIVIAVVAVLGYFEVRAVQLIKAAQAAEVEPDLARMQQVARAQVQGLATMQAVAVQEQKLTAIEQRLGRIEDKLDRALVTKQRPR